MLNPPTRSKQIAIRDGRPLIPRCTHQGCTRDAKFTRGAGLRKQYLCHEHRLHKKYALLRAWGYNPLFTYCIKK